MRAPSDELFSLIKSLTASEKRYFKIWASKHVVGKSNHYEKLFDAIDILPDDKPYDEAAFKKNLRGKSYGKYLRDEKSNLKEILLKSMRVYHAEKTTEGKLSEMLQEIRFLYSKGLMDSCRSLIDKAYKLADEREQYEVKLQLIRFKTLTNTSAYDNQRIEKNKEWELCTRETIDKIERERKGYSLRERIYLLYYGRQLDKNGNAVKELYDQIEQLEQEKNRSFLTFQYAINAKVAILEYRKQYEESALLYKKLINAWEQSEWRINEQPERFESIVRNCLIQIWRAEKFEDMPPLLEKIKSIQTSDPLVSANIMIQYWQLSIVYYINTQQYKEAYTLLPALQKGLKEYKGKLQFQNKVNMINNICIVYLKNADYKGLLHSIEDIYTIIDKRPEYNYVLREIKYLEFIAQFETGGIDILDNFIRNAHRFFKDNKLNCSYSDWLWKQLKLLTTCESGKVKQIRSQIKKQLASTPHPTDYESITELVGDWLNPH